MYINIEILKTQIANVCLTEIVWKTVFENSQIFNVWILKDLRFCLSSYQAQHNTVNIKCN